MSDNTQTQPKKKIVKVPIKLKFELSERMTISVNPDPHVKAVKITYANDGFMATGMMYDKKEISAFMIALNTLL